MKNRSGWTLIETLVVLAVTGIVGALAVGASGCGENDADHHQAEATKQMMAEADRQIGMPAITNFQEKRLMKLIYELRDQENVATYAYVVSWEGKLVYIGRCVGYGLPASVQYSNPMRFADSPHTGYDYQPMPQPEPNGLFMPEGLSATWLMMLDEKTGDTHPVYIEPQIIVSPFPLHSEPAEAP